MDNKSAESLSYPAEAASGGAINAEVAHLLTTPYNDRTASADTGSWYLHRIGFAEDQPKSTHPDERASRLTHTYEDKLAEKIKSKLDPDQKRKYEKEKAQKFEDALHLTPAHDLVDSRVRVAEHNIEEKVKSEMTAAQLNDLEHDQHQYAEQLKRNRYGCAYSPSPSDCPQPGPALTKYIEQVHKAVNEF